MDNDAEKSIPADTLTDTQMLEFASVLEDFLGEEAVDKKGGPIGTLSCYWESAGGHVLFLGITVNGQESVRIVPGRPSQVDNRNTCLRLGFKAEEIRSAPQFDCAEEMTAILERSVYDHFHIAEPEPHDGLRYRS